VTEKSQIDRFKEAARQLGADENEAAFDNALQSILPKKPAELTSKPTNKTAKPVKVSR
jgi:hypothetical protein